MTSNSVEITYSKFEETGQSIYCLQMAYKACLLPLWPHWMVIRGNYSSTKALPMIDCCYILNLCWRYKWQFLVIEQYTSTCSFMVYCEWMAAAALSALAEHMCMCVCVCVYKCPLLQVPCADLLPSPTMIWLTQSSSTLRVLWWHFAVPRATNWQALIWWNVQKMTPGSLVCQAASLIVSLWEAPQIYSRRAG